MMDEKDRKVLDKAGILQRSGWRDIKTGKIIGLEEDQEINRKEDIGDGRRTTKKKNSNSD
jgi:hypothetical protein